MIDIETTHPQLQEESIAYADKQGNSFDAVKFWNDHAPQILSVIAGGFIAAFSTSQPESIRNEILALDALIVSGAVIGLEIINRPGRNNTIQK